MTDDPVVRSLEDVADRAGDISPEIHARFTAAAPQSAVLMQHMDDYMLGRMMQDVLVLLMTPPDEIDDHYLSFEVSSHKAYGVTPDMFLPLLEAVRETLREHLGAAWDGSLDAAWGARINRLDEKIKANGAT